MSETCSLSDRLKSLLSKDKSLKTYSYSVLAYPESFPDCLEWLESSGLPYIVSPLHDSDIYDKGDHAGELKKPHWHVIIKFSGQKSVNQMLMLLDPRFVRLDTVNDIRGAVRYLVHADSSDKHQYDKDGITTNLDISRYFAKKTKGYNPADLFQILEDNPQIVTIRGLCGYAIAHNDNALLAFISKRTYFVKELLCETDFRKLQISQLVENNARYQDICNEIKDLKGFIGVPVD